MKLILGIRFTTLPGFPFTFRVYGMLSAYNTVEGMKSLNVLVQNRHFDSAFSPS